MECGFQVRIGLHIKNADARVPWYSVVAASNQQNQQSLWWPRL